ncbi:MAG: hypothetical protein ACE5MK_04005 [Acidobacteriota bacterium]
MGKANEQAAETDYLSDNFAEVASIASVALLQSVAEDPTVLTLLEDAARRLSANEPGVNQLMGRCMYFGLSACCRAITDAGEQE